MRATGDRVLVFPKRRIAELHCGFDGRIEFWLKGVVPQTMAGKIGEDRVRIKKVWVNYEGSVVALSQTEVQGDALASKVKLEILV